MPDGVENLEQLRSWESTTGAVFDLRIPSFKLINKAMQIAIRRGGIAAAAHPASEY